jgi:2-phosphoglycerate kinase
VAYIIIFIRQKRIHKNLELNMREQGVPLTQIDEIKASERQVLKFFLMICQLLFIESLLYLLE